jgi:hypothetical protein
MKIVAERAAGVSVLHPSLSDMDRIAAHCNPCSSLLSITMRIARSDAIRSRSGASGECGTVSVFPFAPGAAFIAKRRNFRSFHVEADQLAHDVFTLIRLP